VLERELALYSPELAARPRFVVASKLDALQEESRVERLGQAAATRNVPFASISAATGLGLEALIRLMDQFVRTPVGDPR
jgi:GTP-binding protein